MLNLINKLTEFLAAKKVKGYLIWVVSLTYADMFIRNGFRKFDANGFWSNSFLETWGFSLWFMYLIGVLEFVSGILLLIPKFRPFASAILAFVMFGALITKSLFGFINGIEGDNIYAIINKLDLIFFLSTIAMFLYFISYARNELNKTDNT